MIDKDLNKLIDSLDMEEENQEVEYVDDWYCMECDYGPMNEEHDGHQVANVQAVRSGVKSHVSFDTLLVHQGFCAGHDVVQQPPPFQIFNQRHVDKDKGVIGMA